MVDAKLPLSGNRDVGGPSQGMPLMLLQPGAAGGTIKEAQIIAIDKSLRHPCLKT
jgi:hypothetical protein